MRPVNEGEDGFLECAARLGFYRVQFRCGCEFLTAVEFLRHLDSNRRFTCPMHGEKRHNVFCMDKDRYWQPLMGSDHVRPWVEIPTARGLHPDDQNFWERNRGIDAERLERSARRRRWNHVTRIARSIVALVEQDHLSPEDRADCEKDIAEASPKILGRARQAIARFKKYGPY